MVGVGEVGLYRAGRGFLDHGDRDVFEPHGFLTDRPVVRWRGDAGIVAVFADQLPIKVVEEQKLRTQRAILADALIRGVGFVRVCLTSVDRGCKLSGRVPGEGADPDDFEGRKAKHDVKTWYLCCAFTD